MSNPTQCPDAANVTRNYTALALVCCVTTTFGCRAAPQRPAGQPAPESAEAATTAPSSSPHAAGAHEAPVAPKCVQVTNLPEPPRKLRDRKPELSDVDGIREHSGAWFLTSRSFLLGASPTSGF